MTSTTPSAAYPPPDEGPGGPVLVIASTSNPFSRYYDEILRCEGLNCFAVLDISQLSAGVLANYDVAILGEFALTSAQASMLTDWSIAGGNLIAMRPDPQLAGLLGLTPLGSTFGIARPYLQVNTNSPPGAGIVSDSMQFHGDADLYTLAGATAVATLYADAATPTQYPATTLRSVGTAGGHAAAFTYDLARSIVYTRQGNPAWSGQERDGQPPIRSDDFFFGAAANDPQPDWVDLNKVAIPQADEQQRLLVNLILTMNLNRRPLPRFWYFPKGVKAAVVMTGDHHGCCDATLTRFATYESQSPPGCSLADWECVRASSYIYASTAMTDAQALFWTNEGFEFGVHVNTNCADWTPTSLESFYASQLANFAALYPSIPQQDSNRTHCIANTDYSTQPTVELNHGIRLDTTYYYWPSTWVLNRPGLFTGSGMPMRFATASGAMIDCYQLATQMTDESGQTYPFTVDTLLDHAVGPEGFYGAFCANMHTDFATHPGSDAIVASALARGIPVVSSRQMLIWLDGRNNSSFSAINWNANTLAFAITPAAGARNLRAMIPTSVGTLILAGITRSGTPVSFTQETIKGISYAFFAATAGSYSAGYVVDTTPPVCVTDDLPADFAAGTVLGGAYLANIEDGDVILAPSSAAEFNGTTLPPDWSAFPWAAGGTATVAGGKLTLDGARANTEPPPGFSAGRSLEFVATFTAAPYQHIGFASGADTSPGGIFDGPPWAIFSTGTAGTGVLARTANGAQSSDFAIPGNLLGGPHRYRIDWQPSSVSYYVDGAFVHSDTIAITDFLRPAASDVTVGGLSLSLDWVHLSPFAPSGAFLSRIIDSVTPSDWATIAWSTFSPPGTSVALSVRTGDTPIPDASWTSFVAIPSSGSSIGATSRYIQYRADLATTDPNVTPVLRDVSIRCRARLPGDLNGDGVVNAADLPGFVAVLLQSPAAPQPFILADMNLDGVVDGSDIPPFISRL